MEMSPTFLIQNGYHFRIFSKEESRMHVHVFSSGNKAKFWLEPEVALGMNKGFSEKELNAIKIIVKENLDDFKYKWREHFKGHFDSESS